MNVPVDYDNEKQQTKNGSNTTGVLKHNTYKKVENKEIKGMRFTNTKTTING